MKLSKFQKTALCNILDYLDEEEEHYYEYLETELDASNHIYISIKILKNAIDASILKNTSDTACTLEEFFID